MDNNNNNSLPPAFENIKGAEISFGAMMGFASGYVMRQGSKVVAATVGTGFCLIQALSHFGYISVNWDKFEQDYVQIMDRDGDGTVTHKDLQFQLRQVEGALGENIPSGSGFAAGLTYGLTGSFKAATALGGMYGIGSSFVLPHQTSVVSQWAQYFPENQVGDAMKGAFTSIVDALPAVESLDQTPTKQAVDQMSLFVDSLRGKTLEELRIIEKGYKSQLVMEALPSERESLEARLAWVESAKVQVKGR